MIPAAIFWGVALILAGLAPVFAKRLFANAPAQKYAEFAGKRPRYWKFSCMDPTMEPSRNPLHLLGLWAGILLRLNLILVGNGFLYLFYYYVTGPRIRFRK